MKLLPQERIVLEFFQTFFAGVAWMTRPFIEACLYGPPRRCARCDGHVVFELGANPHDGALYRCGTCGEKGEATSLAEESGYPWAQRTLDEVLVRLLRFGLIAKVRTSGGGIVYTLAANFETRPWMVGQIRATHSRGQKAFYVPMRRADGVTSRGIIFGDHRPPHEPERTCLDGLGRTRPCSSKPVGRAFIASVPRGIPSLLQIREKHWDRGESLGAR